MPSQLKLSRAKLATKNRVTFSRTIMASVLIGLIGLAQFVFSTSMAMQAYAGGNIVEPAEIGYDWNRNWLSDLGRSTAFSGKPNHVSARYFNTSVILLGASLACFFAIMGRSVEELDALAFVVQASGLVSSAGLILIGLTPVDLYYNPHLGGLAIWIVPIPVMAIAFAVQSFKTPGVMGMISGSLASIAAIIVVVAVAMYAMAGSPTGYVVMQKVVVIIAIFWFFLVSLRVALSAIETIAMTSQERLAQQANSYATQLKKGYRRR